MSTHGTIYAGVFVTLLFLANTPDALTAGESPGDWLRGTGKELRICLKGEVFESDGRPATELQITGSMNATASNRKLEPTVDGHRFEVWIPVNDVRWHSIWLKAATPHNDHVAYRKLNAYELRQTAVDGIKLKLQPPPRHVEVKVNFDGQPVRGADVKAELGFGIELRSRTEANGIAKFGLLPEQTLSGLTAWTDDFRIGGFSFSRKPTRDPDANEHVIELSRGRAHKFRFIDESGAPVPGVEFVTQIATAEPNYNFIGTDEHSYMRSDAAGEVTYRWFPDWDEHYFYVELDTGKWFVEGDPETVAGTSTFKLKRSKERKRVTGRIVSSSPSEATGGFFVSLRSFQGERENHSDISTTFADADGTFSVDVMPDATYCAYVLDSQWVGEIIDLVPYPSATDQVNPLELSISEGQEVEVIVTSGPQKKAYPNLSVSFRREHRFTWREDRETQHGVGGPQWWSTTDEAGRTVTHTLPGKLKASVYTPLWRTEQTVNVAKDQLTNILLHREVEEKRAVTGQLVLPEGVATSFEGADIQVGIVDGNFEDQKALTCNHDGSFSFETWGTQIGIFACTKDGRAAGAIVVKDLNTPIELRLRPTLDYHGQLLGEGDRPLVGHKVAAIVRIEGDEDYKGSFVKSYDAKHIESTTDEQGNFTLRGLPCETKTLILANAIDDTAESTYLDDIYLEPNELRPRTISRLGKTSAAAAKVAIAERYKATLRDCALCGFRLMLILPGDNEDVSKFVNQHFVDHETNKDIYSFMQIVVSSGLNGLESADAAFLKERNWNLPDEGRVIAFAIDTENDVLGTLEVDVADAGATEKVANFIHEHALPQIDAEKKWSHAFAEAKRSNRRVWARISQRYCGPCFRMARWLDDQHELLDKDYVMLKIDDFRDQNGKSVAERLTLGEQHGIPFHAIFDPDGELLMDSAGPLGNIGHPSGFEGKKQLRKMLLETRQRLTDTDIDRLVESVGD